MPSLLVVVAVAHVAVELDSIFASAKYQESGFNPENGFNHHDKKSMQWNSNVIL